MTSKIKILKIIRYELPSATTSCDEAEGRMLSETEFESRWGKVVCERQYNNEGLPEQETIYSYNDDGFLVREVLKEGDGTVMEERSWEPDERQRIGVEYLHYADGSEDKVTYAYDGDGQLIRKLTEDADGDPEKLEVFEYEDGRLVRAAVYEDFDDPDDPGEVVREQIYTYDGEGRLSDKTEVDTVQEFHQRRVNEYDEQGHRVQVTVFDQDDEPVERIRLRPDEKGRPVEVVEENRKKKNTIHMRYDAQGNVAFQEEYDMDGQLVSKVERIWDDNGLLLESRVTLNGPVQGVARHYVVRQEYEFFS